MAATGLQIFENSFLVKYFDMVNANLFLVWGHVQHGNPAMPFGVIPQSFCRNKNVFRDQDQDQDHDFILDLNTRT